MGRPALIGAAAHTWLVGTRRSPPRCRLDQRGGSLVELAISMPVFLIVALATFTGGLLVHEKMQLTQATRDGARFGATVAQNQTFVSGTWATNVRDLVVERSLGAVASDQVCVALVSQSPAVIVGGANQANYTTKVPPAPCYDDGNHDSGLRVQVSTHRTGTLQAFVFSMEVGQSAKATSKYEG
jgi:Flp pilus assembly protein TadG